MRRTPRAFYQFTLARERLPTLFLLAAGDGGAERPMRGEALSEAQRPSEEGLFRVWVRSGSDPTYEVGAAARLLGGDHAVDLDYFLLDLSRDGSGPAPRLRLYGFPFPSIPIHETTRSRSARRFATRSTPYVDPLQPAAVSEGAPSSRHPFQPVGGFGLDMRNQKVRAPLSNPLSYPERKPSPGACKRAGAKVAERQRIVILARRGWALSLRIA